MGLHKTPGFAVKHFSNAIECLPQGGPEVIVDEMMIRYREKLRLHVEEERVVINPECLESALQLAASGTDSARQALADAGIRISSRLGAHWTRDILLQSLFADTLIDRRATWPAGKPLKAVHAYLESLKDAGLVEKREVWVAQIDEIMRRIEADERTVLKGIRPKNRKKRIGALAIMCWWLQAKAQEQVMRDQARTEVKAFNTHDLLVDFGYSDAHRDPVEGCLAAFGHDRLAAFFDYLETREDPIWSPFYEVGRYWWKHRCDGRDDRMPQWLR